LGLHWKPSKPWFKTPPPRTKHALQHQFSVWNYTWTIGLNDWCSLAIIDCKNDPSTKVVAQTSADTEATKKHEYKYAEETILLSASNWANDLFTIIM
jgi:hypothetical protein